MEIALGDLIYFGPEGLLQLSPGRTWRTTLDAPELSYLLIVCILETN